MPKSAYFAPLCHIFLRRKRTYFLTLLAGVELPSNIQPIVVEERVEHQEIAADRRATLHRIVSEQDDVPFSKRDVDDHRPLSDIVTIEKARRQELALIGKPQNNPRPERRRNDRERIAQLLVCHGSGLPRLRSDS